LRTYFLLQPELIARNFSGYTYPVGSSSAVSNTFSTSLFVYNSDNVTAANLTLQPLYDFVQSENSASRQLNMTFTNATLMRYLDQFPGPVDSINEGAGINALLGSRLFPPSLFKEDKIDAFVDFLVQTPLPPSFHLGAY
jgi:hypothetical protein